MRPEALRLISTIALVIIAICAIIATITLGQIRTKTNDLYNVTAKPHCYLSPNDPRRREIERGWGTQPTSQGICDREPVRAP